MLILLVEFFGSTPVAGSIAGAFVGALVNYFLNYHFTFRSDRSHQVAMARFMTIAGIGFVLNAILMRLCVDYLPFHYLVSQIIVTAIVLVWNFVGNRCWTFARDTG